MPGTDAAFSQGMETIPNLVTVDLDAAPLGARGDVVGTTEGLLDALDHGSKRATFFVPRSIAEGNATLTRRIAERGHEVACLTTSRPAKATPYCSRICGELESTRDAIESATGTRVRGHRNYALALDYESEWMYDVLVDRGFEYDSSRIPPRYVEFGYQPVPRTAHAVRRWAGTLIELPITTTDVFAMRVRLGASGTIRGWPMPVWSAVVNERRARGEGVVMHVRASELRPRTIERVGRIVNRFDCTSVARALPELYRSAPIIES
jgi:peptidoglycan/xylan/chitin deacetylase (PgdA/CDA1 family)